VTERMPVKGAARFLGSKSFAVRRCGVGPATVAAASAARPNISVNADVRELAFVHHLAGAGNIAPVTSLAARGRRLP
jgi:hypothetical protein